MIWARAQGKSMSRIATEWAKVEGWEEEPKESTLQSRITRLKEIFNPIDDDPVCLLLAKSLSLLTLLQIQHLLQIKAKIQKASKRCLMS